MPGSSPNRDLRARVAGRAGFFLAAFLALLGAVLLLDRIGVAEVVVAAVAPAFVLLTVAVIAFLPRSTNALRFYAADRLVPSTYGGLALAGLALGLLKPFAPLRADGVFASIALGFALGLVGLALFSGPIVRRAGAFTLTELLTARFAAPAFRIALAIVVAAACFALALGGLIGAIRALTALGISPDLAAGLAAFGVVLVAAPGGAAGVAWASAVAMAVLAFSFAAPGVAGLARGAVLPFPVLGDAQAWARAGDIVADWSVGAGVGGDMTLVVAVACGLMALAPLAGPAIAAPNVRHARRVGLKALAIGAVTLALAASAFAAAILTFDARIVGARPDALPDRVYAASAIGQLDICGARAGGPAEARAACAALPDGRLRRADVRPTATYFFSAYADLLGLGAAVRGLAIAAAAVIGLTLAAAGFLGVATTCGHDLLFRLPGFSSLPSVRLALTRAFLLAAAAGGALLAARVRLEPSWAVGVALLIACGLVWPLLALALWPRARSGDAGAALAAALCAGAAAIALMRPGLGDLAVWGLVGLLAATAGLVAGVAASLTHEAEPGGLSALRAVLHGEPAPSPIDRPA